ncbi:hypothetical protein EES47_13660 [Streptomyces sp. ADI98-12]|uniref:Uncharacterized protein n=1 Tax=Streptomyces diastaticus subsp. diastaticus TaxID=68040 RepID=A0ABQ1CSJ3_STRDI|nr:hypothetical protein EES47_13660 [Streptomyces sp. ADI98-12]GFH73247.1 hypothetical protein Sdia_40150 [Streptomyces diastaticus subsp. diastaticus]GGU46167.1 hypothetical protein GCM10015534_55950 [Streptomyces diastaticus subsp. diastaticus]
MILSQLVDADELDSVSNEELQTMLQEVDNEIAFEDDEESDEGGA